METKVPPSHFKSVIIVDVATTGLAADDDEILQISATDAFSVGAETFNIFINPTRAEIDPSKTRLHGISKINGVLFFKGAPVTSEPLAAAMNKFLCYLLQQPQPAMLVAHFAQFEAKFLVNAFRKCNLLKQFLNNIAGFSDTLDAAQQKYPKRQNPGLVDHKLKTLYSYFVDAGGNELKEVVNPDVIAIKRILPFLMQSKAEVVDFSASAVSFCN